MRSPVVLMFFILATLPVSVQSQPGAAAEAQPVKPVAGMTGQTVRVSSLPGLVNNFVRINGITGRKKDDPANTRVYSVTDDYGDSVWVRSKEGYPDIGTRYVVEGTVVNDNGVLYVIESSRQLYRKQPAAKEAKPTEKESETKSGGLESIPTTTLIGIALIAAACLGGAGLLVHSRRQAAHRKMVEEQQRRAAEMERQRRELAAQAAARPAGAPDLPTAGRTVAGPLPKAAADHTIDAWGQIRVTAGPHSGMSVPFTGRQIAIGRNAGELQLPNDGMISAKHAEIVVTNDGRLLFVDTSRNGSRVDGKPVHRGQVEIKPDAVIEVGGSTLQLVAARVPGPAAAEQPAAPAETIVPDRASAPMAATAQFAGVELVVVDGPDKEKRYPVAKDSISIGRQEGQDLRLSDEYVSREHATVSQRGSDWVITNRSQRGTLVNGEKVEETLLKHGDRIVLGTTAIEFRRMQ